MPSKSKNKGNSFERDIANYLSSLYGESFIRAPGSGAYVGGKNQNRKEFLHENQTRNLKSDIVPGESFPLLNLEAKSYADFPFHQVLTGDCKLLDSWIDQLMTASSDGDLNTIFMKFNRKGKFVCVPSKYTWITDQFLYYTSKNHNDWLIIEFNHFFKHNKDLLKTYSGLNQKDQSSIKSDTESPIENLSITNIV